MASSNPTGDRDSRARLAAAAPHRQEPDPNGNTTGPQPTYRYDEHGKLREIMPGGYVEPAADASEPGDLWRWL